MKEQKNQATEKIMDANANMTNVETRRILARLAELCSGEPENDFDNWLRERFYPVVALFTA